MRGFMLIVTAIAAFIVVGPASATPTAGVHGAAIRDFSVFGFQGKYTVAVDATRTPSGEIAGHINFFVRDTPLIKFGWFQAEPTHVEINGNTGSVVGEITKLTGWYDTPIITVFTV